ncbi:uncharacterized protein LOC143465951 isoform X2 [Clavelina lepadiformis]|uniref:uncharacterized protein LOC143465951 isoform X2 n=1 Tax=Clavelina lepadiformis TaxID=159417 RepID=UPI0040412372
MSLPEDKILHQDESTTLEHDASNESSSGQDEEQPETSLDLILHEGRSSPGQGLQRLESTEASQSVCVAEQGLVDLVEKLTAAGPVTLNITTEIHHHDNREIHQAAGDIQFFHQDIGNQTSVNFAEGATLCNLEMKSPPQDSSNNQPSIQLPERVGSRIAGAKTCQPSSSSQQTELRENVENEPVKPHLDRVLSEQAAGPSQAANATGTPGTTQIKQPIECTVTNETPHTLTSADNQPMASSPPSTSSTATLTPGIYANVGRRLTGEQAIKTFLDYKRKYEDEEDVHFEVSFGNVNPSSIPVVYPRVAKVDIYNEQKNLEKEYTPSKTRMKQLQKDFQHSEEIKFQQLLEEKEKHRFILIVGNPGSGKTVSYKRLSKQSDKFPHSVCINARFIDIDYESQLSIRELFIDRPYSELSEATRNLTWEWILQNQRKCMLLIDGLDQVDWNLPEKLPRFGIDQKMSACELVASIWNRNLLKDVFVVVTSRPHAALAIPKSLRPKAVYYLQDFSSEDAKQLFRFYTGAVDDSLWNKMETDAPNLHSFCLSPLIVQFVARACLSKSENSLPVLNSLSRVYVTALNDLQHCDSSKQLHLNDNVQRVAKVAFDATKESTVVISERKLIQEGLDVESVQDIVIVFNNRKGASAKVIKGQRKLHFSHQTVQECFAAFHVLQSMSVADFRDFVKHKLFRDEWSMVRQFTCGMLVDIASSTGDDDMEWIQNLTEDPQTAADIEEKKRILIEALESNLDYFTSLTWNKWSRDDKRRYISLLVDIAECAHDDLNTKVEAKFPEVFDLNWLPLNTTTTALLCQRLSKQNNLKGLYLSGCFSAPADVGRVISAIIQMPAKLQWLDISDNKLPELRPPEFFAQVEDRLDMRGCFYDDNGGFRFPNDEEKSRIQGILDQLDDSTLEVVLGYGVILSPQK